MVAVVSLMEASWIILGACTTAAIAESICFGIKAWEGRK